MTTTQEAGPEVIREAIQEMIHEVIHEVTPEALPLDDLRETETIHHPTVKSHGDEATQEMIHMMSHRGGKGETTMTTTVPLADAADHPV